MKKWGKKRVPGCYCKYYFTCGLCLAVPTFNLTLKVAYYGYGK